MEAQHLEVEALAEAVQRHGVTKTRFESLALRLSPQEERLFARLSDGEADTIELRNRFSLGNISAVRASLNAKLAAAGDLRMVVCDCKPHTNQFGERGHLGVWRLLDARPANEAGDAPPGARPVAA